MENIRIGLELRALSNTIRRYFEFSSYGTEIQRATGNNKWIIRFLAENEGQDIFQKDIENYFSVARSTVSKVLNLMEQKGMIQRLPVVQDARLKKIVLTEEAKKIQGLMREDSERMERILTKGFTEKELETLRDFLQRMRANLS